MRIFLYFTVALFLFTSCRSTKKTKEIKETSFIACTTGSFWVFKDSEGFVDTLTILSSEKTAEGIKVDLNSEKWLIKSTDSIFVRCQTRGGGEFSMPLYINTKESAQYNTCLGDVVTQVEVKRLKEPKVISGKSYTDCTEYFIKPYTKVIIADRVGPVKYIYLDIDGTIKSERNLIDYKTN